MIRCLRHRHRHLRLLFAIWVMTAAAPVTVASAASPTDTPRIVKFEQLGPDFVRITWSNGIQYAGSPIKQWKFESWQSPDGTKGGGSILIEPAVEIHSQADLDRAAEAYRRAGRSPAQDRAALGLPASEDTSAQAAGELYASGCASDSPSSDPDNHVSIYGCYRRYRTSDSDPSHSYSADESKVTGMTVGGGWPDSLTELSTQHRYTSGYARPVLWDPGSDQSYSSCRSVTVGFTAYGATVSETFKACPDRIHPMIASWIHAVWWSGYTYGENRARESAATTLASIDEGRSDGFQYYVSWAWSR